MPTRWTRTSASPGPSFFGSSMLICSKWPGSFNWMAFMEDALVDRLRIRAKFLSSYGPAELAAVTVTVMLNKYQPAARARAIPLLALRAGEGCEDTHAPSPR